MTRTELLVAAITHELDQHSHFLDSAAALRAVNVFVKLNHRSGQVRSIVLVPELERDFQLETFVRETKGQ